MLNKYAIIVDERDTSKFNGMIHMKINPKMAALHNHVWGLNKKYIAIWKKITKNDIICFALENDSAFRILGIVHNVVHDQKKAIQEWGDDFRSSNMEYLIYFHLLHIIPIGYHELLTKNNIQNIQSGIYELKILEYLIRDSNNNDLEHGGITPIDKTIPDKIKCDTIRYIRDTYKSKTLKKKYQNICQACSYSIKINSVNSYSEVHHVKPLHEGGNDDHDNMLVLCPTHHAEFDYRVIGLSKDGKSIIDKNGNKKYDVYLLPNHNINKKIIEYQLSKLRGVKQS